jgi:hypothetical protein
MPGATPVAGAEPSARARSVTIDGRTMWFPNEVADVLLGNVD